MTDGLIELEIFIFGCSAMAYIIKISNAIAKLETIIEHCPNCPHSNNKGDE